MQLWDYAIIAITACGATCVAKVSQVDDTVLGAGAISVMDRHEFRVAFAPDRSEALYSYYDDTESYQIGYAIRQGRGWRAGSAPGYIEAQAGSALLEPQISDDGLTIVFNSNYQSANSDDFNLWYTQRSGDGWTPAVAFSESINSSSAEWYPTIVNGNRLYFGSERAGGVGGVDLYVADNAFSSFAEATLLGSPVNSPANEYDPCIDPHERFMIFVSDRHGGFGGTDLYIALPDSNGDWSQVYLVGAPINDERPAPTAPMLSQDGQSLLVSSQRGTRDPQGDIVSIPLRAVFESAGLDFDAVLGNT
jgi:Tol biopolymer transport system component